MADAEAFFRDFNLAIAGAEVRPPWSGHHGPSVRVPIPRRGRHGAPAKSPSIQVLVIAKAPSPGRVKTRLCPPCSPEQAAAVAAAALADTLDTLTATPAVRRTLVIDGQYKPPTGWHLVGQRGRGLADRLVHAFVDTALPGAATFLVGMDTPQLSPELIIAAQTALGAPGVDAVFGLAADGGWWGLGLRNPADAEVLHPVPVSTPHTGRDSLAALRRRGLAVTQLPILRDVDTAADALTVAAESPATSRFATAVRSQIPVSELVAG
jgi:glycosyltransferase A (GT-A) superfamily protein (DUF2064 family)